MINICMHILRFKLNSNVTANKKKLVLMFMEDWISSIVRDTDYSVNVSHTTDTIVSIRLAHRDDAIAIRLRGVPRDLSKFIEVHELVELN